MQKLDPKTLPPEVADAYATAEAWIAEQFKGRRLQPKPTIVVVDIPEEEDAAGQPGKLYAIIVPPGGAARARIERSAVGIGAARDRGGDMLAAKALTYDLMIVECCLWVQGMGAEPGKDPRILARDYLKSLRDEPGSLATGAEVVGEAVAKLMVAPEVRLGKL